MHPDIDRQQQQRIADQLRRLSGDFQQPYGWAEFQRRAHEQSEALRQGRRWGFAAVAASLLIIVSGIAALSRTSRVTTLVDTRPNPVVSTKSSALSVTAGAVAVLAGGARVVAPRREGTGPVEVAGAEAPSTSAADSRPVAATDPQVKAAATESHIKSAEHWLASLPPEPIIVKFGSRAAVTGLEDRIAQLDDMLTAANAGHVQPARINALQQERGRLVDSLVQVRYAEALVAE
jgi:hypothetical protein